MGGKPLPALEELPGWYAHRYGQEHGYRYDKQDLLWEEPRLRTPEQLLLWSRIGAVVRHQLYLARPLVQGERRPWERSCVVASRPATPRQVRRGLSKLSYAKVGTPAKAPQPRGKCPGRAKGAVVRPAPRYRVISKRSKEAA